MALGATIYNFDVNLSHVDRGIYETLNIRAARHPSETEEYLVTRLLAYCLEHAEGISFGKGLAEPDEPALTIRDLSGALVAWIEVGAPDAARLHRASKASPRVALYTYRDAAQLVRQLAEQRDQRIHRAGSIEVYGIDRGLVDAFVARLDRRTALDLAVTDGHLYLTIGGETFDGALSRHAIVAGAS